MTTQAGLKNKKIIKNKALKKSKKKGGAPNSELKLNSRTEKEILKASKDFKNNRNMSPAFYSAKEAIDYLKKFI